MIKTSITNIFSIYIGIILLAGFIISFFGRRTGKVLVKDKDLYTCPVCAYRYIINSMDKIHRCPQCESLNTEGGAYG